MHMTFTPANSCSSGKDAHGEEDSALGSPLCVYVNNALGPA